MFSLSRTNVCLNQTKTKQQQKGKKRGQTTEISEEKKKKEKKKKKSPPEEGQNRKHDLIKHGNINQNDIVYQMRVRKGNTT